MTRLYVYIALGLAVMAGLTYTVHRIQSAAAQAERAKQEKVNAQFRVRAAKGAVDFDVCDRAGGLYNFGKGTCKLP